MLRRSSRVKLLPHVDFLGGCIDSKCAKMGAKSLSNPEIEGCVSATQGSSFCSFVVLHHFVEKVHDNQVIQAVAFFLSPSVGLVTFSPSLKGHVRRIARKSSFYEGPKRLLHV